MYHYFLLFISISFCFTQHRSLYSVGDTISIIDQNIEFNVCHGDENYNVGENFSLANLNGLTNGGEYKVTLISMNATW